MVARRMILGETPSSCKSFFTLLDTSPALVNPPPLISKDCSKPGSASITYAAPFFPLRATPQPAQVKASAGLIHRQIGEQYGNFFGHGQGDGFPVRLLPPDKDQSRDVGHFSRSDDLKVGGPGQEKRD